MADIIPALAPHEKSLPDFLPVRMLNEYTYCPRLGYMMWVQSEFADNKYTVEGRFQHRHVDAKEEALPEPEVEGEADARPQSARSVLLSAPSAGLIAKIDLLEIEGRRAVPVDTKRGKKPDLPGGAHEPERVQLCAQGLILEENGYTCTKGVLYFSGSRSRVEIAFDENLKRRTLELADAFRRRALSKRIPEPLDGSPKCNDCSLVGICLPDETGTMITPGKLPHFEPRRLIPARTDALPVYIQKQGAYVGKKGDVLSIKYKGQQVAEARMYETSQLNLMGNVQVTTQTVQELCRRGIPVLYFSSGGWFYGMTLGNMHKNIELRLHQYRAASDSKKCLELARRFVTVKIQNCRTLLRRNSREDVKNALAQLSRSAQDACRAESKESLLGVEGNAARIYFQSFSIMLSHEKIQREFHFEGRNRRPPRDPVNAMLSLAYSLLAKDLLVTLTAVGFDPYLGFFHHPRYGRPSLALDLMEEFRPLVADSTVLGVINNSVISATDFIRAGDGIALKPKARRKFIMAYERRMDQLIRHPIFGYKISYRQVLEVQARLFGRYVMGEIPKYPEFQTR